MLTFRKVALQGPVAARRMAAHLAQRTLPAATARRQVLLAGVPFADPDGATLAVPRADLDPALARGLGVDARAPLDIDAMTQILMGKRADGTPLRGITGLRKISCIDLCFSSEKSVSLLWALAGHAAKAVIAGCQRDAVARTMAALEPVIGRSRRGKGGRDGSEPGTLAWFAYEQYTAREVARLREDGGPASTASDPQCHLHVIVPNAVWSHGGRVTALDLQHLGGRVLEFGALYAAFLAEALREFGVETVLDRATETPRVPSVPEEVRQAFSGRTAEGEVKARALLAHAGERLEDLSRSRRVGVMKSGVQKLYQGRRTDGVADAQEWWRRATEHGWKPRTVVSLERKIPRRCRDERLRAAADLSALLLEERFEGQSTLSDGSVRTAVTRALIEVGIEAASDVDEVVSLLLKRTIRQGGCERTLLAIPAFNSRGYATPRYTTGLSADETRELQTLMRSARSQPRAAADREARNAGAAREARLHASFHLLDGPAHRREFLQTWTWNARSREAGPSWISIGSERSEDREEGISKPTRRYSTIGAYLLDHPDELPATGRLVLIESFAEIVPRDMLRFFRSRSDHGLTIAAVLRPGDVRSIGGSSAGFLREAVDRSDVRLVSRDDVEIGRAVASERIGSLKGRLNMMRNRDRAHLIEGDEAAFTDGIAVVWSSERNRSGKGPPVTVFDPAFARRLAEALRQTTHEDAPKSAEVYVIDTVDFDGTFSDLPCSEGDPIRLQTRVNAKRDDGRRGLFGVAGSLVVVRGFTREGLRVTNGAGDDGLIAWDTLRDAKSSRLRISQGLVDVAGQPGHVSADNRIFIASGSIRDASINTISLLLFRPLDHSILIVAADPIRRRLAARHSRPVSAFTDDEVWDEFALDVERDQASAGQVADWTALASHRSVVHVLRAIMLRMELRASSGAAPTTLDLRFALRRSAVSRGREIPEIQAVPTAGPLRM